MSAVFVRLLTERFLKRTEVKYLILYTRTKYSKRYQLLKKLYFIFPTLQDIGRTFI